MSLVRLLGTAGRSALYGTTAGVFALSPTLASAQESAQQNVISAEDDVQIQEIIVTGSSIRGIAPAGAATIGLGEQDIAATGAATTAQLLANVPQLSSFNSVPVVNGSAATASINRVNLRNLPGSTGGGSSTLVLVDGHRLPGMGILQTAPDPDAIAPGAIERVEIVPDGGSSTYGADAVGGVVNFITRKRFDGVEVNGRIGIADNYTSVDTNLKAGKTFGNLSLYATYNFAAHDSLYGRDRDYVVRRDYEAGTPLDYTCNPGNVIAGGTVYALPNLTAGTGNRCDISDDRTFYPTERRHSVYAGAVYDDGGPITFSLRGFYTHRVNESNLGPLTGSVAISPTNIATGAVNPLYRSVGGANADATQTVYYNFADVVGTNTAARAVLETWQIAPSMDAELGNDWQLRFLMTYGKGKNRIRNQGIDSGTLSNLVLTGQFDPYDLSSPINSPYLADLTNYGEYAFGRNELANSRLAVDGPLFQLPSGDVRVALGAEYMYEKYTGLDVTGSFANVSALQPGSAKRNTAAVFGEVQIPIVGPGNRIAGIHSLNLSASGRYDHYSDFGGTFNPRVGLTYEPIEWFSLRGSWSKSFQAPSLADTASAAGSSILAIPFVAFAAPGVPATPGQAQLFLTGGGSNLRPQKARTYTVGGELRVPFVSGLKFGANYYNIKFKDLIGLPPVFTPSVFYPLYPDLYTLNPTAAQVQAFGTQAPGGSSVVAPYALNDGQVYAIIDGRRFNQANVSTSGLDFSAEYTTDTGFGSLFANINGNYILTRKEQTRVGAPVSDTVDLYSRLSFGTTLGAMIGGLRAQATWNHTGSYDVTPLPATLNQTKIKSFNVVNLFFQYDFKQENFLKDVSLTLNVSNVFDQDPPLYRLGDGYIGGTSFTLGRMFQLGVSKKF